MDLTLGPISYFWPRERVMDFYCQVADWPVQRVSLGETVCSKRRALSAADWLGVARDLAAAGKQVSLATLTLIEAESELSALKRWCDNDDFQVEANDMAAVYHLRGRPFVAGPGLNLYHPAAVRLLVGLGMQRWVPPVELPGRDLAACLRALPCPPQVEVFAYGRLPLAHSARCFTARHRGLPKDRCNFVCKDYPDGLAMATREGQDFLAFNGIQTQSARSYNLIGDLASLRDCGVTALRISPQSQHTGAVVEAFANVLAGAPPVDLSGLMPVGPCNGFWHGRSGVMAL